MYSLISIWLKNMFDCVCVCVYVRALKNLCNGYLSVWHFGDSHFQLISVFLSFSFSLVAIIDIKHCISLRSTA